MFKKLDQHALPSISGSELIEAARSNNRAVVQAYIAQHANDPTREALDVGSIYHKALYDAAKKGNVDIVNDLLTAGANPNVVCKEGYSELTPLHIAAQNGYLTIVQALVDAGANQIFEARKLAKDYGRADIVGYLFDKAPISDSEYLDAARSNNRTVVQAYIAQHANDPTREALDVGSIYHKALYDAAKKGNVDIVNDLLAAGANPNVVCKEGYSELTPLHIAAQNGYLTIVQALVDAGANQIFEARRLAKDYGRADIVDYLLTAGIQHAFQSELNAAVASEENGNFHALWELAERSRSMIDRHCPVSIEEIFHSYELISENSPYRAKARTQMAYLMLLIQPPEEDKEDGLDVSKSNMKLLKTRMRVALEGDAEAQPIRNFIFQEMTGRTGPLEPEMEVSGDLTDVYTRLAFLLAENTCLKDRIQQLENRAPQAQKLENHAAAPLTAPLRVTNVHSTHFGLAPTSPSNSLKFKEEFELKR